MRLYRYTAIVPVGTPVSPSWRARSGSSVTLGAQREAAAEAYARVFAGPNLQIYTYKPFTYTCIRIRVYFSPAFAKLNVY